MSTRHIGAPSPWCTSLAAAMHSGQGTPPRSRCYSNQDKVSLYLNGTLVETKAAHRVFEFELALEEGFNILLAVAGDVKDSITLEKVETEPACYTLPEFNERQEGVANWFKQMGSMGLDSPMEFPEGYYSIKDNVEVISQNEEALPSLQRLSNWPPTSVLTPGVGMWDMMKMMTLEEDGRLYDLYARGLYGEHQRTAGQRSRSKI